MIAGVFVEQAPSDGHWFMGLQFAEGDIIVKVGVATADNADEVVKEFTTQLKAAQAKLRQAATGLITVQEVPDGFKTRPEPRRPPTRK